MHSKAYLKGGDKMNIDDMILKELHSIKIQGKWTTKKAVVALSDWYDFPCDLNCKSYYDEVSDSTYVLFFKMKG